jgi:hypothetical protein
MPFLTTHLRGARAAFALAGAAAVLSLSAAPALAHDRDDRDDRRRDNRQTPVVVTQPETAVEAPVVEPSATAPDTSDVCTPASLSKPFLPWGDANDYTLVPGGDIEDGLKGWELSRGADVVPFNNWFRVADRDDRASLLLRPGASALSAPVCIDATYSSFRFFARRLWPTGSDLKVEVLWWQSGATHATTVELHPIGGLLWAPVAPLNLPSEHLTGGALEPVQFRFTVTGRFGAWLLDDIYVDPFSRG